ERAPKDPEAWWLLGRISRHAGLPAASDEAFRRATELRPRCALPPRVAADHFQRLVGEALETLSPDARRRLERTGLRVQAMPSAEQVRSGVDPDALTWRERSPQDVLTLYQANHENRSRGEDALRALINRSLSRA